MPRYRLRFPHSNYDNAYLDVDLLERLARRYVNLYDNVVVEQAWVLSNSEELILDFRCDSDDVFKSVLRGIGVDILSRDVIVVDPEDRLTVDINYIYFFKPETRFLKFDQFDLEGSGIIRLDEKEKQNRQGLLYYGEASYRVPKVVKLGDTYMLSDWLNLQNDEYVFEDRLIYDNFLTEATDVRKLCSLVEPFENMEYPIQTLVEGGFGGVYCIGFLQRWLKDGNVTDPITNLEIVSIHIMTESEVMSKEWKDIQIQSVKGTNSLPKSEQEHRLFKARRNKRRKVFSDLRNKTVEEILEILQITDVAKSLSKNDFDMLREKVLSPEFETLKEVQKFSDVKDEGTFKCCKAAMFAVIEDKETQQAANLFYTKVLFKRLHDRNPKMSMKKVWYSSMIKVMSKFSAADYDSNMNILEYENTEYFFDGRKHLKSFAYFTDVSRLNDKGDWWYHNGKNEEEDEDFDPSKHVRFTKIIIPDCVKTIDDYLFSHHRTESLIIPHSVETIGVSTFEKCWIERLTILEGVKLIGKNAFKRNKVKSLIIPNSVKSIGDDAFFYNGIETLRLGENVVAIGSSAFANNMLKNISIPDSVKSIGENAFRSNGYGTVSLTSDLYKTEKSKDEYWFESRFKGDLKLRPSKEERMKLKRKASDLKF